MNLISKNNANYNDNCKLNTHCSLNITIIFIFIKFQKKAKNIKNTT